MKSSELASHRLSEGRSSIESASVPMILPECHGRGTDPSLESLQTLSARSSRGGSISHYHDPNRYLDLKLDKLDSDSIGISVVSLKTKHPSKSFILVKSILERLNLRPEIQKIQDLDHELFPEET